MTRSRVETLLLATATLAFVAAGAFLLVRALALPANYARQRLVVVALIAVVIGIGMLVEQARG